MQSKGAIKFVAVLLAIACLWQLSFTLVTNIQEKKAAAYAEKQVEGKAAWEGLKRQHIEARDKRER